MCLGVSKPTKGLAVHSTAYALCNQQDKQKNKKIKNIYMSKKSKSAESLLESCQLYIIANYKAVVK